MDAIDRELWTLTDETPHLKMARETLSRLEQVGALMHALWDDPRYRPFLEDMIHQKWPHARLPDRA